MTTDVEDGVEQLTGILRAQNKMEEASAIKEQYRWDVQRWVESSTRYIILHTIHLFYKYNKAIFYGLHLMYVSS